MSRDKARGPNTGFRRRKGKEGKDVRCAVPDSVTADPGSGTRSGMLPSSCISHNAVPCSYHAVPPPQPHSGSFPGLLTLQHPPSQLFLVFEAQFKSFSVKAPSVGQAHFPMPLKHMALLKGLLSSARASGHPLDRTFPSAGLMCYSSLPTVFT